MFYLWWKLESRGQGCCVYQVITRRVAHLSESKQDVSTQWLGSTSQLGEGSAGPAELDDEALEKLSQRLQGHLAAGIEADLSEQCCSRHKKALSKPHSCGRGLLRR